MALAWKVSWEQSLKGSNPLSSAKSCKVKYSFNSFSRKEPVPSLAIEFKEFECISQGD